jgi:hypothetical protein
MEELAKQRELQDQRMQYYEDLQKQRIERLTGKLKIDVDVMAGRKRITEAFDERRRQAAVAERDAYQRRLHDRKAQVAMGPGFYRGISEHERQVLQAHRQHELEREMRRKVNDKQAPVVPKEYKETRAHKAILDEAEHVRHGREHPKEAALEKRHNQLAYAEDVKHSHAPMSPAPPPKNAKKKANPLPRPPQQQKSAAPAQQQQRRSTPRDYSTSENPVPTEGHSPADSAAAGEDVTN